MKNFITNGLIILLVCVGYYSGQAWSKPEPTHIVYQLTLPEKEQTGYFNSQSVFDKREPTEWLNADLKDETHCLALNIYFEARNQIQDGKVAVGLVTINRVLSERYPNTVCGVVWQKRKHPRTGRWVAQFSWTWDGKKDRPWTNKIEQKKWQVSQHIANAMLAGHTLYNFYDITNGSTHYHADYVDPFWNKHYDHKVTIGDHLFYRDMKAMPVALLNKYGI